MQTLSIDLETFSSNDLIKGGVYSYASALDFTILLFGYHWKGKTEVIDLAQGEKIPQEILKALTDPNIKKTAFNSQFERVCLNAYLKTELPVEQWWCTSVLSSMTGLPHDLNRVGAILKLKAQKDASGKTLIRYFSLPCKPTKKNGGRTRNLPEHDPEAWQEFKDYCKQDVEVEIEILKALEWFKVPKQEILAFWEDQRINDRGIKVDLEFAQACVDIDERVKAEHVAEMQELSGIENPNSVAQIKAWLKAETGVTATSLTKDTVKKLIDMGVSDKVRRVLELRQLLGKTSTKKYEAMLNSACPDERVRGLVHFYGANRTGRWCLTGDHEVLTDKGWARLDDWGGGHIACWTPTGEAVSFRKAERVVFDYKGQMYHFNSKRIDQISTPDHKMYVKTRYDKDWEESTAERMAKGRPSIPFTGKRSITSCLDHYPFRVLIMAQADGHYTKEGALRFHFRKQRKIERCKMLLRRADIVFSEKVNSDGSTVVAILSRHLPIWLRVFKNKTFDTWLWDESPDVFFDELVYWDGYQSAKNSIQYSTSVKQNADMVQAFAHMSGRSATMNVRKNRKDQWATAYRIEIWLTPKNQHEIKSKPEILDFEGKVYCASTPTGYFLVRRNGKVWVTGNSGRIVQLQNLPQNHIPDLDMARQLVGNRDIDTLRMMYGSVPNILSQLIRTALVAKEGHTFVVADFSAIEARVIAWLAQEKWRLDVFNGHGKIYEASASAAFGIPIEQITKGSDLRQKGKVMELACIAEGELVLTHNGLKPIQDVSPEDCLWDGQGWVAHDGVVYKGEKNIIEFNGLRATPDHKVWNTILGAGPIPFGVAALNREPLLMTEKNGKPINEMAFKCDAKNLETIIPINKARTYDILNAGPENRFTVSGRLVHNCGFQGGVGAIKQMGGEDMGLSENDMKELVDRWRAASKNIVRFWYDVERCVMKAIGGEPQTLRNLKFYVEKGCLMIQLPSGRCLVYRSPALEDHPKFDGKQAITFFGLNQTTKNYEKQYTYGGKLVENIVQGTARDCLVEIMLKIKNMTVGHIHDEVILEVPEERAEEILKKIINLMGKEISWAKGLPLAGDGYITKYYKKD